MLNNVNISNLPDYGRSSLKNTGIAGSLYSGQTLNISKYEDKNLKGPSFKSNGFFDGKTIQKILDKYKENKVLFDSVSGLFFAAILRPATFFADPTMEKDDKVILSVKSIVSGLMGPIFTVLILNHVKYGASMVLEPFARMHELEAQSEGGRKFEGLRRALGILRGDNPDYKKLAAALDGEEVVRYNELEYDEVVTTVSETLKDFASTAKGAEEKEIKINTLIDNLSETNKYSGNPQEFAEKFKAALKKQEGINWTKEELTKFEKITCPSDVFKILADEIEQNAEIFTKQDVIKKRLECTKEWLNRFKKIAGEKIYDFLGKDTRVQIGTRLLKSHYGKNMAKEITGGMMLKLLSGPAQSIATIISVPISMAAFHKVFFPTKKQRDNEIKTNIGNIDKSFVKQNRIQNKTAGRVA